MLEEGMQEVPTAVFRDQRPGDLVRQAFDILGKEVGHLAIRGMAPTVLDDIAFGRICGQELHMDAGAIEVTEPRAAFLCPLKRSQITSGGRLRCPWSC